uniref:hypothetical protein n=1 Tax=Nocardia farcinica TaxID=37329 RepID=UPI001E42BBE0
MIKRKLNRSEDAAGEFPPLSRHNPTNVSGILLHFQDLGIRLEIGDDFAKYRTYRSQQFDRGP